VIIARQHNALKITSPMRAEVTNYFERPYKVIHGDQFAAAIKKVIRSREVKSLRTDIGSIDQFTDSTNVIEDRQLCERLQIAYN
jgi:UDP-2,3-diacylglucosamine pyrophosphatase LpxH